MPTPDDTQGTPPSGGTGTPPVDPTQGTPPQGATPPTVPEKYEFNLGEGVQLDPAAVESFTPILKELGISQEGATKLAAAFMGELGRQDGLLGELYTTQADEWAKAAKSDKEFGGANFEANAKIAQQAIARFGTPELKQVLNETGLGNHPEFVRLFWKLGQTIQEDTNVQGGNAGTTKSIESLLFDHPTSQTVN